MKTRSVLFFLISGLFPACNTISYVGIETYNPAEVSFPPEVRKVLIVNNTVPQPDDNGYVYTLSGVRQDTARASADSAAFDACRELGELIVEDSFFEDVLLYHDRTREDGEYSADRELPPDRVEALCEETGTDAVIAFDRLLFLMNKDVRVSGGSFKLAMKDMWIEFLKNSEVRFSPEGYAAGDISLGIEGVIRCYLPGRGRPLATVYLRDSLYWFDNAENLETLSRLLPSPEEALRTGGRYAGMKARPDFVPHWNQETRWVFGKSGARWREAAAYAASDKWEEAASRWQYIYEHASRWSDRAKAASNLALCYEMETRLETALEWADKSYHLFLENKDHTYTDLLQAYVETLQQRIRSDQKLNGQFREKEEDNS